MKLKFKKRFFVLILLSMIFGMSSLVKAETIYCNNLKAGETCKISDIIKGDEIKLPSVPLDKVSDDIETRNNYAVSLLSLYLGQHKLGNNYYLWGTFEHLETGKITNINNAVVELRLKDLSTNDMKVVETKKFKVSYAEKYDANIAEKIDAFYAKLDKSNGLIIRDLDYLRLPAGGLSGDRLVINSQLYAGEYKRLELDKNVSAVYFPGWGGSDMFAPGSQGDYLLSYDGVYYKILVDSHICSHRVMFVPKGIDRKDYASVLEYRIKKEFPNSKVSVAEENIDYSQLDGEYTKEFTSKHGYDEEFIFYIVIVDDLKAEVLISSNKDTTLKQIVTKDENSGVVVESNEMNVPEDVKVEAKIVNKNDLNEIKKLLNNDKIRAYDISLDSKSEGKITKTKAGKFQVTIPLGKESAGKHYVAYFIDDEGKIQRYAVNVDKEGNATFKTNHFSRYIISEEELVVGDLNYNKKVDLTDVLLMLKVYFKSVEVDEYTEYVADINENSNVDLTDVLILLKNYFKQS